MHCISRNTSAELLRAAEWCRVSAIASHHMDARTGSQRDEMILAMRQDDQGAFGLASLTVSQASRKGMCDIPNAVKEAGPSRTNKVMNPSF